MVKKSRNRRQRIYPQKITSSNRLPRDLIYIGLMWLLLLIFFYKIVFLSMVPLASDTIAWRGSAQCMIEYRERTGKAALWNSHMFSGMPGYMISFGNHVPSVDNLLRYVSTLLSWQVVYSLIAGISLYFLLLKKKVGKFPAFLGALAFIFTPHFFSLLEAGHNTKFRSIMYMPLVFLAVDYLFERRNLLSLLLASVALSLQLRANHPQIIYYTWIMLALYWLFNATGYLRERELKRIWITGLLFAGAIAIALALVAQPYLSNYEYARFTIRGAEGAEGGGGLPKDYATSWSFHPLEMLTFLIPSFFGLRGAYYWGWMPFTSTSMYMGLVPLLFVVLALIYKRDERLVRFLALLSVVALLISFGRHLPWLSHLLLTYLPYFNKFRAPSMILSLLQFSVAILAAYGIDFLFECRSKSTDRVDLERLWEVLQTLSLVLVGMLVVGLIAKSQIFDALSGFMFEKLGDAARYNPQTLSRLKEIRFGMLGRDFVKFVVLFGTSSSLVILWIRGRLSKGVLAFGLTALLVVDLWWLDRIHLRHLEKPEAVERAQFARTQTDVFLLKDKSLFRVFPLGKLFNDNRWAYYHQTIGGYHAAKLQIYQDIIARCLYSGRQKNFPLNMHIINMLNVKYLIARGRLPEEVGLRLVNYDKTSGYWTYLNPNALPRAFFVDRFEVIRDRKDIFRRLNAPDFDPCQSAILEKVPGFEIKSTDRRMVTVDSYDLHRITLSAETDKPSLLVLSEIYYPAGWKAFVDGEETEIYKTDYILRSIYLTPGAHKVEFVFDPWTYRVGLWISRTASLVVFGLIGIAGGRWLRKRRRL